MPPTISMMAISIGVSNSTVLMKSCANAPITAAGRNASSTLSDEAARARIVRERQGDARQLHGVDAEDGQDGAELDQHLERLAGRADAEEVLGEQEMAGRRYGQELGQALDEAQEDHFPDRHRWPRMLRGFFCAAARISRICRNAVPLPRHTKRLSYPLPGLTSGAASNKNKDAYLSNAHADALPALPLLARRAPGARRAGIDVELVEERPWEWRPEFLALNPAGELPVLQLEGGPALCGVYAISEYLAEEKPPEPEEADAVALSAVPRRPRPARRDPPPDRLVQRQVQPRGDARAVAGKGLRAPAARRRGTRRMSTSCAPSAPTCATI